VSADAARRKGARVGLTVMVAEDDPKQAELARLYLTREGYTVVVLPDGRAALEAIRRDPPDLLVLDLMMPRMSGWDVCRVLRAESNLPILVLTARSTTDDLLLGLDLGADDYLTKPYDPRELVARVRALLRRSGRPGDAEEGVLIVGELRVDPVRYEVEVRGARVECTAGEFSILRTLAEQPGRVFTRTALLETRGGDTFITERTVDVHILNLRKKIESDPRRPTYLLTVFGVGYKMSARPAGGESGRRVR
jgi:DNA-binding response OmpR family regulator